MTTEPIANPIPTGDTLTAKTICLSIDKGKFGNSKKASLAPVSVNGNGKHNGNGNGNGFSDPH